PPLPEAVTWRARFASLGDLVPTAVLILLVLGTIYLGVATPTEAAALGVLGSLVFAAFAKKLTFDVVHASARSTARTTSLIGLIILSGFVLNYVLSSLRLPQALAQMVKGFALPPWGIMLIYIVGVFLMMLFPDIALWLPRILK